MEGNSAPSNGLKPPVSKSSREIFQWLRPHDTRQAAVVAMVLALAGCGEAGPAATARSAPGVSPVPPEQAQTAPAESTPAPAGGTQLTSFRKVFDQPRTADGKPLTFFLGGQFCPFCASMRWPLVKALGRFGTFSGLGEMRSKNGSDGFGSIATYDFAHATYQSDLLAFQSVEAADANGNPLQQPNSEQDSLINRFDPNGSIPFVFLAGRDIAQLPYSPGLLVGKSFGEINAEVNSPSPGQIGQAINAEADAMTAVICKTLGAKPADTCGTPAIQALVQQAP